MNEETTDVLTAKASAISKEMAEALKQFGSATAMMMYAKMMEQDGEHASLIQETIKKNSGKQSGQKMDKMLSEARLKWQYATDSDKKKVAQMEQIIKDGQQKIKDVYKV